MNLRRKLNLALIFSAVIALTACSSLKPPALPDEFTPAPALSPLWAEVAENTAGGDWHILLNAHDESLDWRLRAIDSATDSIDLQTFLWDFDTVGSLVLDHLVRAADRGVLIRVLVDDSLLFGEDAVLLAIARHPNIEYRVFNPFKRRASGMVARNLLNLGEFHRLDHRMHNKSMVIDNRVGIVGGRNLADEYFGLNEEGNFRDMELLFGGPVIQKISAAFDLYWNDRWALPIESISHRKASPDKLAKVLNNATSLPAIHLEESPEQRRLRWLEAVGRADYGEAILFVDEPPPDQADFSTFQPIQVANEFQAIFDSAREEIIIVSAYLIPTPALEGAVARAVERGVRVRILTNSIASNNHLSAHSAYRNHIDTLLESGAELHEIRTQARDRAQYMLTPLGRKQLALHAKALIIDRDKVFIGSANLDPRSLRINSEMGFLIISEPFNEEVRKAVEGDFHPANAWQLKRQSDGDVYWIGDDRVLKAQPATSFMQRLEDWFFAHLPIEGEL